MAALMVSGLSAQKPILETLSSGPVILGHYVQAPNLLYVTTRNSAATATVCRAQYQRKHNGQHH